MDVHFVCYQLPAALVPKTFLTDREALIEGRYPPLMI